MIFFSRQSQSRIFLALIKLRFLNTMRDVWDVLSIILFPFILIFLIIATEYFKIQWDDSDDKLLLSSDIYPDNLINNINLETNEFITPAEMSTLLESSNFKLGNKSGHVIGSFSTLNDS